MKYLKDLIVILLILGGSTALMCDEGKDSTVPGEGKQHVLPLRPKVPAHTSLPAYETANEKPGANRHS